MSLRLVTTVYTFLLIAHHRVAAFNLANFNITIDGVGEEEEGNVVNISCTVTDTAYPPSITLSYDPFGPSNPDVESILTNTSTYRTTMVYNNETETYTTTIVAQPITVNRYLNFRLIFCNVMVNSSTDFRGKRFTVFYGPDEDKMELSGTETTREGLIGMWVCRVSETNPAVTLTWYNGSTEFTPDTPPVVRDMTGNTFETRQEWKFELRRDYSGSNISCVATGYNNRTITKSRQIGEITFAPELEIKGGHMYYVNKYLQNYYIDEGATLNLTCAVVAASPASTGSWKGRGSDILVIPNMPEYISIRDYFCEAENLVSSSFLQVHIIVQYGPHVYVYSEISRKEGESVTIDASINASPEPARIVWRREGQSTILSTGYKMVLSNITKEDAGKYIVEATSIRMRENNLTEEFTGNATVVLKVQYGPEDSVRLSPNVTIVELEAGDPVPRVTCVADCEPECHYRWTQLYRNTVRDKSYNADLDLGMASSAMVGIYLCEVHNDRLGDNNTANITFELRVKYAPEIQSVVLDGYTGNPYNESAPITVTAKIRAYPGASVTWGITKEQSNVQFMSPDSRYSSSRSVDCTYDCEITEVLTLNTPSCTDTGNKYSLYAENEKGNSTTNTTYYSTLVSCTPRLADRSLTNQTYRICEGAELNMSVTFVSVPGPFMGWYDLPDTSRFIHNKDDRGNYRQVYFTTSYYIPTVYKYMFGTYLVQADNFRGPRAETYIQVVQDSSCSGGSTVPPLTSPPSPSSSSSALPQGNKDSPQKSGAPVGAIVGSVIGAILVAIIIVAGATIFMKRNKKQKGKVRLDQMNVGMARIS
uniref:Uncharacterized protein LOC111127117 n=1 Tax=Crassostrea virginica TaxID=6565 RepID=A0A8B8DJT3_CRAVI|nr:uncharacterized protein LOC111127117 [Crassostrea virginica]XP_022327854.1 uncharacterized protein LOC111127117 [Crassostrea virginica]XP_022327855.1 uncharacterized protein LOC111127117 [Crassostrea virginica]XP_022327856.1 uncharacterized protein LOC111127117 [Crassostrea virginica]XP_022327857.1 uncharacterized protein LOC111127117 [Crassostrea virginica]XP_022327858.1 uncharacterized protein LOC111127117 [Crassostrea virginica]